MTYEQKAELFTKALSEAGGNIAAALQAVDRVPRPPGSRLLTDEQVARLQQRRAAGAKLAELADDFGLTEGGVSRLCRGIVKAQNVSPTPARAGEIIAIIGHELALDPGWERVRQKGRRGSGPGALGRRVAIVAMRAAGITYQAIADVMGRHHSAVLYLVPFASKDPAACRLAALVAERLAGASAPLAAAQAA